MSEPIAYIAPWAVERLKSKATTEHIPCYSSPAPNYDVPLYMEPPKSLVDQLGEALRYLLHETANKGDVAMALKLAYGALAAYEAQVRFSENP